MLNDIKMMSDAVIGILCNSVWIVISLAIIVIIVRWTWALMGVARDVPATVQEALKDSIH